MTIVAGVDFGTQSVRVSIVDHERGVLGFGVSEYPVNRRGNDPDFATQSHAAQMDGLVAAMRTALATAKVSGRDVKALALDTTGSTVAVVGKGMVPLDDYYLWCDHRAKAEAARITEVARSRKVPQIDLCGGTYSVEWGFSKLLHWLRSNPTRRSDVVAAIEHCDLVAATLCGITDPDQLPRSICAMGHKWLYSAEHGGFPPPDFWREVDPLLDGVHELLRGCYLNSDRLAGELSSAWAAKLGLTAGIPIPVGALDAHWDAVGAGIAEGDVVNVVGSSTCIMAIAASSGNVPGVCGVVPGSIHPTMVGIEAGLSAVGDIFDAIARRANVPLSALADAIASYRAGQTGLLRLTWDNGDRTVLVNPNLGGVTLGWTLGSTAADELFAAIEGTAFHTRLILERMREHGVPAKRLIHGGGIPQRNETLNRVYANVLGMPVLIPERPTTSLGAAIFAFMAVGTFPSITAAQKALCPPFRVVEPDAEEHGVYEQLHSLYRTLYFSMGDPAAAPAAVGGVLPELRSISERSRHAVGT